MKYKELFDRKWSEGDKMWIVIHTPLDLGPSFDFYVAWPYKVVEGYVTKVEESHFPTWSSVTLRVHSDEFNGKWDSCDSRNCMYQDTVITCMIEDGSYSDNFRDGRVNKFLTKEEADKYLIKAQKQAKDKIEKHKQKLVNRRKWLSSQAEEEISDIEKSLNKISKLPI